MTRIASYISKFFAALNASVELAAAVENHRAPTSKALKTLGIPERQFRAVQF